jgi:hypothetical protein
MIRSLAPTADAQMLSTDVVGLVVWEGRDDDYLQPLLKRHTAENVRRVGDGLLMVFSTVARPPSARSISSSG